MNLKKTLSTTAIMVCLLLTSCSSYKLSIKQNLELSETIELDLTRLNSYIEQKEDMIILVYLSTCSTCTNVISILNDYVSKNHYYIYKINYEEVASSSYFNKVDSFPSLVFIHKGNIMDIYESGLTDINKVNSLLNSRILKID